jgi:RNA polymerase sigma-70 factor, ECF subfamily
MKRSLTIVDGNMSSIIEESVLVEECLKGNQIAEEILYKKYFRKMMIVSIRYLKNEEDASEILNSAFLKVFAKLKQYKFKGSLEGWIKRIVINAAIDFIKDNKAYRNTFIHTDEFSRYDSGVDDNESLVDVTDDNVHLNAEQIFEMVKELPEASRVVFNLYVIEDYTHREIAESLKISEGTSKWHLFNARKQLKEKIKHITKSKNNKF